MIPESGKILLGNLESWALESGAQGIQNPSFTEKDWNPATKEAESLVSLERLF